MRGSVSSRAAGALAVCWVLPIAVGCSDPSAGSVAGPAAGAGQGFAFGGAGGVAAGGSTPFSGSSAGGSPAGAAGSASPAGAAGSGGSAAATANEKPFVYVGTSFYDAAPKTLVVLALDPLNGELSTVQTLPDLEGIPSWIAVAPSRQFLYLNLEDVPGVVAFKIDQADGTLTRLNAVETGQQGSAYLSLDMTGRFALQANYDGGTVSVVSIGADGSLGGVVDTVDFGAGSFPHSIRVDPTNEFALVANRGSGAKGNDIAEFLFDASTGKLTANEPARLGLATGTGPRHLEFHPNGKVVYTTNERASAVGVLAWDAATGTLTPLQQVSTVPPGVSGAAPTDVHVHPSGKFVYAINRNEWSIALFSVDQLSFELTFVEHTKLGAGSPRNFAIDPHGAFLVVGHLDGNAVPVLSIDPSSGKLAALGSPKQLPSPSGIAVTYLPGK